jgi:hypothetical protein
MARQRKWRQENPEKTQAKARAYYHRKRQADPSHFYLKRRDEMLRKVYGISLEQYETINAQQGGVCAICRQPEPSRKGNLNVDHDHRTGARRGLLCNKCNAAIGQAQDSPEILRRMIDYLNHHSHKGETE